MIFDTIENIECYVGLGEKIITGLRYLRDTDFSKLPDGRQEIDGINVFANIMSYEPRFSNELPESHREYIDIQFLIEGVELVGVSSLSDLGELAEARPESDVWFNHGSTEKLTIGCGKFLLLYPQDAHAPGIAVEGCCSVRKCVIKVRV